MAPYDDRATEADILACFRLLLGRNPHDEEWVGHSGRVGEALPAVVSSYLDSLEFTRRRLQQPAEGRPDVAALEGFRILANADDLAVGKYVLSGSYEPEVVAVFRAILRPGMAVIDVGANIGFFTMLAASIVGPAGSVLAIEPNPANARMAEASRRLNGFAHVTVLQAAAGRQAGMLAINTSFSNGMTSSLEGDGALAGDGVLEAETVACVAIDQVALGGRRIDLMKIDVEGAEYNALLGSQSLIRRDRPVIVFEFGPGQMPGISGVTGEEMLQWLIAEGYALDVIQLDGPAIPFGRDVPGIMRSHVERGRDHIDIVARPAAASPSFWRGLFTR